MVRFYTVDQVERYAGKLSSKHHDVLIAARDNTMERTAEILSMPIGTVKSRLHRARAKLGKLIDAETPANG